MGKLIAYQFPAPALFRHGSGYGYTGEQRREPWSWISCGRPSRRRSLVAPHVIDQALMARPCNAIGDPGETPGGRSFDGRYLLQCCVLQISLMHLRQESVIIGRKSLIGLEIKYFSKSRN